MRRYWPLTAVLLAFWLGRETGAREGDELRDGRFKVIEAEKIVLRSPWFLNKSSDRGKRGIRVRSVTQLTPGRLSFEGQHEGKPKPVTIGTTELSSLFGLSMRDRERSFRIDPYGAKWWTGDELADNSARVSVHVPTRTVPKSRIEICDVRGRTRAVLGATTTVEKKTGKSESHPESTLALYDESGGVLELLPR